MEKGPQQLKYEAYAVEHPTLLQTRLTHDGRSTVEEQYEGLNKLMALIDAGKFRRMDPRELDDSLLWALGKIIDAKRHSLERAEENYRLRVAALDEHNRATDVYPAVTE